MLTCLLPGQERNVHGMKLVEGEGNAYDSRGKALEGDVFNTVFIVVSIIFSSQCGPFSQICVRSHALSRQDLTQN